MMDRTDDLQDWMEDEARFAAEDAEDEAEMDRRSAEEHAAFMAIGFTDFCHTEGCEGAGTEKMGDTFVCSTCLQAAFQRMYDREREMGRGA